MAIISFKAEKDKGFEYQEGEYTAFIQTIEEGVSQTSNLDYYKFTLRGDKFGVISAYVSDNMFGRRMLYQIFEACGIDVNRDDVDTDELLNKYVGIKISKRKNADGTDYIYNDKPQYQVTKVFALEEEEDEEGFSWDV